MHLPSVSRATGVKRAFVLMLAATFVCFAIWLKVSPNLRLNTPEASSSTVKLWLDPTPGWENQVKLAPVNMLFCVVLISAALLPAVRLMYSVSVPRTAAKKDVFFESRHWFRPPPLF